MDDINQNTDLDNSSASTENIEISPTVDEQQSDANTEVKPILDYAAQFQQETGYKDIQSLNEANQKEKSTLQQQADHYKNKFEQAQIKTAIMAESAEALSGEFINEFLGSKAQCDKDGKVTIGGVAVADAISTLLQRYPFLAKARGSAGSGAPQSTGTDSRLNRSAYQQLSHRERSEFISKGGKVKD